jgi:cob(I)alamin adenosyltransferase
MRGGVQMDKKGLIHFYYGDGKGKTTAALGLAIRASGCGKNVVFVQFLKDWKCGELSSLAILPNVTVLCSNLLGRTFIHEMSDDEKAVVKAVHDDNLKKALGMRDDGQCDLLILDEAADAYQLGVLDAALFESLLNKKPESLELVITGHTPDSKLLAQADYVTEMIKHKHPYDKGIVARRGIEF